MVKGGKKESSESESSKEGSEMQGERNETRRTAAYQSTV